MTDALARLCLAPATAVALLLAGVATAQDTPAEPAAETAEATAEATASAETTDAPEGEAEQPTGTQIDIGEMSYSIGFQFGNDLRRRGGGNLDQARLAEGVTDGATGSPPEISAGVIGRNLVIYQRLLMNRQAQVLQQQIEQAKEAGDASQRAFFEERLRQIVQAMARQDEMLDNARKGEAFFAEQREREGVMAGENGLLYEVLVEGTGDAPVEGDTVEVHYVGTLIDGTKFDSSYDKGEPATFTLAPGQVIGGWVQGLQYAKPGGKIKLYVPPQLAYGPQGTATIPPNATLIFEVDLREVNP
ncbi:MAG: FKBP-type peptidyl-prolyl cis-trans isomerase [Planctomycetota bacterium]